MVDLHTFLPGEVTHPLTTAESKTVSTVATAEDLKALYERQLRYDIGNLGLGSEERRGFWQLLSASRHMQPGEFHEEEPRAGVVVERSPPRPRHDDQRLRQTLQDAR